MPSWVRLKYALLASSRKNFLFNKILKWAIVAFDFSFAAYNNLCNFHEGLGSSPSP